MSTPNNPLTNLMALELAIVAAANERTRQLESIGHAAETAIERETAAHEGALERIRTLAAAGNSFAATLAADAQVILDMMRADLQSAAALVAPPVTTTHVVTPAPAPVLPITPETEAPAPVEMIETAPVSAPEVPIPAPVDPAMPTEPVETAEASTNGRKPRQGGARARKPKRAARITFGQLFVTALLALAVGAFLAYDHAMSHPLHDTFGTSRATPHTVEGATCR